MRGYGGHPDWIDEFLDQRECHTFEKGNWSWFFLSGDECFSSRIGYAHPMPDWMAPYADQPENFKQGRRLMLYKDDVIYGSPHVRSIYFS